MNNAYHLLQVKEINYKNNKQQVKHKSLSILKIILIIMILLDLLVNVCASSKYSLAAVQALINNKLIIVKSDTEQLNLVPIAETRVQELFQVLCPEKTLYNEQDEKVAWNTAEKAQVIKALRFYNGILLVSHDETKINYTLLAQAYQSLQNPKLKPLSYLHMPLTLPKENLYKLAYERCAILVLDKYNLHLPSDVAPYKDGVMQLLGTLDIKTCASDRKELMQALKNTLNLYLVSPAIVHTQPPMIVNDYIGSRISILYMSLVRNFVPIIYQTLQAKQSNITKDQMQIIKYIHEQHRYVNFLLAPVLLSESEIESPKLLNYPRDKKYQYAIYYKLAVDILNIINLLDIDEQTQFISDSNIFHTIKQLMLDIFQCCGAIDKLPKIK